MPIYQIRVNALFAILNIHLKVANVCIMGVVVRLSTLILVYAVPVQLVVI